MFSIHARPEEKVEGEVNHEEEAISLSNVTSSPESIMSEIDFGPREITAHVYNTRLATWAPTNPKTSVDAPDKKILPPISSFSVITWNVDFTQSFTISRIKGALSFIAEKISTTSDGGNAQQQTPTIILIQELESECFEAILGHPFVQQHYIVSDISPESWSHEGAWYGTVTLIPKVLANNIHRVFRTAFQVTDMSRDALYIDLLLPPRPPIEGDEPKSADHRVIRIANVHLESLRGPSDEARVAQLESVKEYLSAPEVYGGLVAGDMNPIGPLDSGLPSKLGLSDAWLSCRAGDQPAESEQKYTETGTPEPEEDSEGYTWGYQPKNRYPPRRMDKILLSGQVKARETEVIGKGLKTPVFLEVGSVDVWVSDHYGLLARVEVV